jgi:hypothetical protein
MKRDSHTPHTNKPTKLSWSTNPPSNSLNPSSQCTLMTLTIPIPTRALGGRRMSTKKHMRPRQKNSSQNPYLQLFPSTKKPLLLKIQMKEVQIKEGSSDLPLIRRGLRTTYTQGSPPNIPPTPPGGQEDLGFNIRRARGAGPHSDRTCPTPRKGEARELTLITRSSLEDPPSLLGDPLLPTSSPTNKEGRENKPTTDTTTVVTYADIHESPSTAPTWGEYREPTLNELDIEWQVWEKAHQNATNTIYRDGRCDICNKPVSSKNLDPDYVLIYLLLGGHIKCNRR